jgi:hypothetical protein
MVESDSRNSDTRHGKRHRGAPRDVNPDDANSHVPASTPRDDKHNHHKGENPNKERDKKMTKRTTRIVSSVAILIAFLFTLSVKADASQRKELRRDKDVDARANVKIDVFKADVRPDGRREARLYGASIRDDYSVDLNFKNDLDCRIEFLSEKKDATRYSYRSDIDFQDRQIDKLDDIRQEFSASRMDTRRSADKSKLRFGNDKSKFRSDADRDRAGLKQNFGVDKDSQDSADGFDRLDA